MAQDNVNENRGFDAESVYNVGDIDSVDVFGGGLSIVIPIGNAYPLNSTTSYGFQLTYNSKLWDYRTEFLPPDTFTRISVPTRITNAGLGWTFNPGFVLEENGSSDITYEWNHHQFVASDGSRHYFEDTLHHNESADTDVWYSRDNTYLRLKKLSGTQGFTVEFPNGEIHTFGHNVEIDPGNWQKWMLTRVEDQYGNWMAISYPTPSPPADWVWTITDVHNRSHSVTFEYFSDIDDYYVKEFELEAFGGATATYALTYAAESIEQGCGADNPMAGVDVRLLTRLDLPEDEFYDMTDSMGDPRYLEDCTALGESGAITGIRLPTRGQIEWDYDEIQLPRYFDTPFDGVDEVAVRSFAVGIRRTLHADDSPIGQWNYFRELQPPLPTVAGQPPSKEQRVHVKDPLGHCTTHYFDANAGNAAGTDPGWAYGLPFSFDQPQSGGHLLSTQVYDGIEGTTCGGTGITLLRSSYLQFAHDELPFLSQTPVGPLLELWHNTNRRVESTRTVYHDDDGKFSETTFDDLDGVGHYRDSTTDGDFDAGNTVDKHTNFNPGLGTYEPDGTGDFTEIPPSTPWVLDTFDRQTVSEGADTAVSTACFDTEGFLTRRRVLVGASEGNDDVVSVFVPDATSGDLTVERSYGGDLQSVNTGSNLCNLNLPAEPVYELEHDYDFGARKRSFYNDYVGGVPTPIGFNSFDATIDESTGLVVSSRDTAGIETAFSYDLLARLVTERPEIGHGSWIDYTYDEAMAGSKAQVSIQRRQSGGGAILYETQVVFDDLGRVFQEKSELAAGGFGVRETVYNARGDRASVSEVELSSSTNKTEFLNYDPFGRPGVIRPADGTAHDVTLAYTGVREIARTSKVATGVGGAETDATFTEVYDRQGRLYQVIEPGAATTTTYSYDVGNRLASSVMDDGSTVQTRTFVYDDLGFLRSETQPELGMSGNGTVTYSNYDARGHLGRVVDDRRTLDYAYDAAERFTTVSSPGVGTIKALTYDGGATNGGGKLHQATRTNRRDIPGDGTTDFIDVMVTETFDYDAVGGRISSVLTTNSFNDFDFLTSLTYDDLGRVEDLTYPTCQGSAECPNDSLTVRNSYLADELTMVGTTSDPSAFATIDYHANGLWSTLSHGNGVTTTQVNDPSAMRRPSQIFVSGVGEGDPFDSGLYAYDGSGNVKFMGADEFQYDSRSRLIDAMLLDGWEQEFTFDDFGNVELIRTKPPGGSFSSLDPVVTTGTNRLTNSTYDGSGNMTIFNNADPAWTQDYDLVNMAATRNFTPDASQWVAIYTASDERLAVWDDSSGELEERWTLRSPSGEVLREFRFAPAMPGDLIFADGFESGDTSAWSSVTGLTDGSSSGSGTAVPLFGPPVWSVKTSYIYRGSSLLADYLGGSASYYHLDHLGSVRQITNEDTDVARSYDYLPYGREIDATEGPRQFTAHERDSHLAGETDDDLDYMHARYCDPRLGRFVNVDPLADSARAARPQSWNRYSYVENNPMKYVDPTGEIVSLANLTDDQQRALITELNDFTGNTYAVNKNMELVLTQTGAAASTAATAFLGSAIRSKNVYNVVAGNARFGSADRKTGRVTLDFRDFIGPDASFKTGDVDPRAFSLGAVFFHEVLHAHFKFIDPDKDAAKTEIGVVVGLTNRVRQQRGMPTRGPAYAGFGPGLGGRIKVNFQNVNPQHPEKRYWLRARDVKRGPQP